MDQRDFDRLIEHYPRIRRAALILSNGNDWDADDLAQETMLQAARGWRSFAGASQVHTWLYSILLNQHRRRLRTGKRGWRTWIGWFERKSGATGDAPDRRLENDEWRQSVWSAVGDLPEAQKQTILLRYSEELSYDEIARVLQCPVGTVKSRLHHALGALEKKLGHGDAAAALARMTDG
ncbi:MAG TPA: sigma-70 family RNA polymerase sigma factor [Pirellulales bacterium]|nr:sigma-70 family RNA polymerase sigma factor [Pirellulales bacterium]